MKDRPILFSGEMVRALLDGRKTQTRRLLTPRNTLFDGQKWPNWLAAIRYKWADAWVDQGPSPAGNPGPYLKLPVVGLFDRDDEETVHRVYPAVRPGCRLWVREGLRFASNDQGVHLTTYAADGKDVWPQTQWHWARDSLASIHMPRWASRLTLTVTDMRVQRLQEISRGDAMAEGCPFANMADGPDPREWYASLWNTINGPDAWSANPWVVALTFGLEVKNDTH